MEENVGPLDGNVRMVLGALLALAGLAEFAGMVSIGGTLTATLLVVAGLVLVVTGYTGMCPIYRALGMNTREE